MTGVRSMTRLEQLQALVARVNLEIDQAARRVDLRALTDLRELRGRLLHEIDHNPGAPAARQQRQVDRVTARLRELDVTRSQVRAWGVRSGRLTAGAPGRTGLDLVEAFAALMPAPGDRRSPCRECYAPRVHSIAWAHAGPEVRRQWSQAGFRRGSGRGLCSSCHQRLRVAGALPAPAPAKPAGSWPCTRCGHTRAAERFGMCPDCLDVEAAAS